MSFLKKLFSFIIHLHPAVNKIKWSVWFMDGRIVTVKSSYCGIISDMNDLDAIRKTVLAKIEKQEGKILSLSFCGFER